MANQPNRYIRLSQEEDERLRELEQNAYIHKKVRLRAQILRLSQADFGIAEIAEHVGKSYNLVRATFHRWQKEGYAGLADHYEHHGRKAVVTEEIEAFMKEKLCEARTWTCAQLAEVVAERYEVKVGPEGIRKRLGALGYSWKKGRFVPEKRPSDEQLNEHKAALETLKRGQVRDA
jgi:transposase